MEQPITFALRGATHRGLIFCNGGLPHPLNVDDRFRCGVE